MTLFARLIRDDAGETVAQYAVIALILVVVGLATASTIGANLRVR